MRILWLSNPNWMHTGYGIQTKAITSRLARDGHEIHVLCTAGLSPASGIIRMGDITFYPPGRDPWGNDMVQFIYNMIDADCMIGLGDIFCLTPKDMPNDADFEAMIGRKGIWCQVVPFDHDPIGAYSEIEALRACTVPIAMSQHGKALMEKNGIGCVYIPHGIDTDVAFRPDRDAGVLFRKHHSIPQDAFLITFVGYNRGTPPTRKGIEYLLQAVADLNSEGYDDIHVYLHTDPLPIGDMLGSLHIPKLAIALGVGGDKITCHLADPRHHILGYPDTYMRAMYNAGDVFCLPSGGEGFGLPIVEAQACGSPVIVTHWTSMPELVGGGWTVPYAALTVAPNLGTKRAIVDLKALKEAILLARAMKLNHPGDWQETKLKARKHAETYNASNIYQNLWRPFIHRVEEELVSKKGVSV